MQWTRALPATQDAAGWGVAEEGQRWRRSGRAVQAVFNETQQGCPNYLHRHVLHCPVLRVHRTSPGDPAPDAMRTRAPHPSLSSTPPSLLPRLPSFLPSLSPAQQSDAWPVSLRPSTLSPWPPQPPPLFQSPPPALEETPHCCMRQFRQPGWGEEGGQYDECASGGRSPRASRIISYVSITILPQKAMSEAGHPYP